MVSVEPAGPDAMWMIRVARGETFAMLSGGTAYGPVAQGELPDQIAAVLQQERAQGYVQITAAELIEALQSNNPAVRGRAAQRLGWRRENQSTAALLIAADNARGDICPIVDALGRIGDPAAIELARTYAAKKNLSRRRSGVEALRNLGDAEGLALARQASHKRLPAAVADVLGKADESRVDKETLAAIETAIAAEDPRRRGAIADALYERDTTLANRLVRRMLTSASIRDPHQWRYTKSILKRSMLREDVVTFGKLAHAIERAAIDYNGATAVVTSGLDGQKRSTKIFGPKTQAYVRRATWRYMRDLARYRPERYVDAAAQVLCQYRSSDARPAKGAFGAFADAFVLHHILYARSTRLKMNWRSLRVRFVGSHAVKPPEGVREEAFPQLWDAHPAALLTVLGGARLPVAQDFAIAGVRRHPEVMRRAKLVVLLRIAAFDRSDAVDLARHELERRFEANRTDWTLVAAVLQRGIAALRELSIRWLTQTAPQWSTDPGRLLQALRATDPKVRSQACRLAIPWVSAADLATRERIATRLLETIAEDEAQPGAHAPMVALAREALVAVLEPRFSLDALIKTVRGGTGALRQIAGFLLGRRPGALAALGLEGLVGLANHELIAVRAAGHAIVRGAAGQIAEDPAVLYALSESEWADTRAIAFELLEALPLPAMGLEGVIGLCDSTRPEVQALGRALVQRHFTELDAETVLFRLAEHPDRAMRSYALALITAHLRPGMVPLARIDAFVRATLFDLRPRRPLKIGLLEFLRDRGLMDERQGEHVAGLLGELLRSHTVFDFQRVSQTLALIQHAFPTVHSDLQLREAQA